MYLTLQGLVLRVTDYNDRDALLTLLTPNHGKLTVKARGLRRKNSPLIAPCQLLAYGEFTLFENRGYYTVNEAHSLELFQNLRRDLIKLSLGTYFAQVAEVVCQEDLPNPELLSLVLNCLYALSKLGEPEDKVKAVLNFGPLAWPVMNRIFSAVMHAEIPFRIVLMFLPAAWNAGSIDPLNPTDFGCRSLRALWMLCAI